MVPLRPVLSRPWHQRAANAKRLEHERLLMMRRIGLVLLLSGFSLMALAIWGLWRDIEWIAQPFYAYAWWSYILVLDGFCALRRGHSLFTTRRRFVFPICLWSITFWFFFELLNLRFQNWYYVGVILGASPRTALAGAIFTIAAFSTVFLGIFETYEALTAAGLWRNWRGHMRKLPHWISYTMQGVGAGMAAAAIFFPYYLAPLIWGSLTLLLDPWNYRRGARALLRDVEARDWGLVARVFVAGLVCGLLWECLNFLAPQKWIYTVRGLENFKLFEMPLLGFLGFPALALDSIAAFALLASWFLGNETWEHPGDLSYTLRTHSRPKPYVFWTTVSVQPFFWVVVSSLLMTVNVGSFRLELADLPISTSELHILNERDIHRPRQFLRTFRMAEQRGVIQRDLGWTDRRTENVLDLAELYTFKGIGRDFGILLRRVGVHRVNDLGDWNIDRLHARLTEEAEQLQIREPRLDMVRVWVHASRDRGVVMRTGAAEPTR